MYLLKPLRPGAVDAATGAPLPDEGVRRAVLLPPDHYAQRVGDIEIVPEAAPAALKGSAANAAKGASPTE